MFTLFEFYLGVHKVTRNRINSWLGLDHTQGLGHTIGQ